MLSFNETANCDSVVFKRLTQQDEQTSQKSSIEKFPYEIMSKIFCHLELDAICKCFNVSRTWRNQLLSMKEQWQELKDIPNTFWHGSQSSNILSKVSNYVEQVHFESNPTHIAPCIETFRAYPFTTLRSLTLIITECQFDETPKLTMRLYYALSRLKDTLTNLDLKTGQHTPVSIRVILTRCPNLIVLKVNSNRLNDSSSSTSQQNKPHNSLLSLKIITKPTEAHKLYYVFRLVPNIRHLAMPNCLETHMLLEKYPQLYIITDQNRVFEHVEKQVLQPSWIQSESQGVQYASFEGCDICHQTHIQRFLMQVSQTVRHIYLGTKLRASHWSFLSSSPMPLLTELHISSYPNACFDEIPSVLRNSPFLETVTLEMPIVYNANDEKPKTDAICNALSELPYLSTLDLTSFGVSFTGFEELLKVFKSTHRLKRLSLVRCVHLSASILLLIASLQNLEVLDLKDSIKLANLIDESILDHFACMAQRLPYLAYLRLSPWMITDDFANTIIQSQSIRKLYVFGTKMSKEAKSTLRPIACTSYVTDDQFRNISRCQ